METKTFTIVTTISLVLSLTAAAFSLIGIAITGLYPGILVLLLLPVIPIASKSFAKKFRNKSNVLQRKNYRALLLINLLTILVVLWMTFVILVDRVFSIIV